MALPGGTTLGRLFVTAEIIDNGNQKFRRRYEAVNTDATDFITNDLTVIHAALNGVMAGSFTKYVIAQEVTFDAVGIPASGVEGEKVAALTLALADPTKSATETIPTPDPAIFVATTGSGANDVDQTNAAVIAFVGLFQAGEADLLKLSDGEQVNDVYTVAFIKGKRSTMRSHKSRTERKG